MSWIKIIAINAILLLGLITVLEVGAGLSRLVMGKEFKVIHLYGPTSSNDVNSELHPCNAMKTDVLLSHIPHDGGKCEPLGGKVEGEYVLYDVSSDTLPTLLILGGSTTSGLYQNISDGETWPKVLAFLAKDYFRVVNGGMGGYSSLQEFYKLARDGARFDNLNMIISLNGINELPYYFGDDSIRSHQYPFLSSTQHRMNLRQKWIDQRIGNSIGTFLPNLISLFAYISKKDENKASIPKLNFLKPINAAERWEINVKRMQKLAELEGATYLVFLQPTMGLPGVQSNSVKGTNDYRLLENMDNEYTKLIRELYAELRIRCERLSFCIDISDSVPPTGNFYNDIRHHNAEGNKLLANEIMEFVKKNSSLIAE